jgi:hypothetical protein
MAYTPIANGNSGLVARGIINGIGTGLDSHIATTGSSVHSLKTMALQSASAVIITGGSIVTELARFGTTVNNTHFETSGFMELSGSAIYWNDLRIPMTSTTFGGSKPPGFSVFRTTSGSLQGVFAHQFDKQIEEELYFQVQMPHGYKLGTNLHPHAHWSVITVPAGGTTVRWGLEYTFVDVNGVFLPPTIVYTTATDPVTQYKHRLSEFTEISGSSISTVSAMMSCRIFRDVANDNFDDDAALLEIDFHYQSDTLGSRQETAK